MRRMEGRDILFSEAYAGLGYLYLRLLTKIITVPPGFNYFDYFILKQRIRKHIN
jgi:hypothetical protein